METYYILKSGSSLAGPAPVHNSYAKHTNTAIVIKCSNTDLPEVARTTLGTMITGSLLIIRRFNLPVFSVWSLDCRGQSTGDIIRKMKGAGLTPAMLHQIWQSPYSLVREYRELYVIGDNDISRRSSSLVNHEHQQRTAVLMNWLDPDRNWNSGVLDFVVVKSRCDIVSGDLRFENLSTFSTNIDWRLMVSCGYNPLAEIPLKGFVLYEDRSIRPGNVAGIGPAFVASNIIPGCIYI